MVLASWYRMYSGVMGYFKIPTKMCWSVNRGEGLSTVDSCEGMGRHHGAAVSSADVRTHTPNISRKPILCIDALFTLSNGGFLFPASCFHACCCVPSLTALRGDAWPQPPVMEPRYDLTWWGAASGWAEGLLLTENTRFHQKMWGGGQCTLAVDTDLTCNLNISWNCCFGQKCV